MKYFVYFTYLSILLVAKQCKENNKLQLKFGFQRKLIRFFVVECVPFNHKNVNQPQEFQLWR